MKHIAFLTNFSYLNTTLNIQNDLLINFSKNFKKIYFINSQYLRFFPNLAKKYYDETAQKINHQLPKNVVLFNPKSEKDFKNFLKDKNILIVNNFGRSFWSLKTIFLLKKYDLTQVYIDNLGGIGMGANLEITKPIRYLSYIIFQSLFKKIIIPIFVFIGLIPRIDLSFITKKKEIYNAKKNFFKNFLLKNNLLFSKQYKFVNSRSYDAYLDNKNKIQQKYIVHLDIEMNGRHEIETRGRMPQKDVKSHYYFLRKFLIKLSKDFKKKVIICIHPGVKKKNVNILKNSNLLKGFKIVQFKTREYLYKSFLVTNFDTSAIVDAAVLKKKIIGLWSNYMDINQIEHSKTYPRVIGYLRVNIESYRYNKKDLLKKLNKNTLNYQKFISSYHCFKKNSKGVDEIISTIKRKYKCE